MKIPNIDQNGMLFAFSNSPIGIYIAQGGKFVYINKQFKNITGYSEDELIGNDSLKLVTEQDRKGVYENAIKMVKGIRKHPYPCRVRHKTGSLLWIMESIVPINYCNRPASLGHFMDITHMKHMEKELLESEKYRTLFQLANEGIVIVRYDDGRILDSNAEFLKQTGFELEELRQKKVWEIQHTEFQQEACQSFFRFREAPGGIVSWKICTRRKGNILPVEIVAHRMMFEGEDVILCLVRDVTERESMMRALSRSTEEWRKSFDAIGDAVLIINKDFVIHKANEATARLLGMDVRKIPGNRCHKLFHGLPFPPEYCPKIKVQSKGVHSETEIFEPNLERTLHFSSSPIKNDKGRVIQTVEIINDVTVRRNQEKESALLSLALAESFEGITEALSDLVESRDPYTAGHSRHVAKLAVKTGEKMGFDEDSLKGLRICALLHDIGKAIIPAGILNKPGKLSEHEWGLIKQHPVTAFETLKHIPFPWPVADVVLQHHERLDGTGYPNGIIDDDIHPWARIISVADITDAMTSHRPYRPRMPKASSLTELRSGAGLIYDPDVVQAFIRVKQAEIQRTLLIAKTTEILDMLYGELNLLGLDTSGFLEIGSAVNDFNKNFQPLVIIEHNSPGLNGIEVTRTIKHINSETEVILIAENVVLEEALRALREGASDFLEKPLDLDVFKNSVFRSLKRYATKNGLD